MPIVKHFLIVFDRATGELVSEVEFDDATEAHRVRFETERGLKDAATTEVVVLTAEDRDALRRTHGRYFESLSSIAARASRELGGLPGGAVVGHSGNSLVAGTLIDERPHVETRRMNVSQQVLVAPVSAQG
ncbi:MAG: hypothetical protein JWM40_3056 [Frankiales bacterium]|nr:hypothetical protein [Frankiales bacterium]